jgi:hypothetical protein
VLDRDPGPLALLALDQVRPFPPRPSFEAIVADALGTLAGLDARAASARADLADAGGDPTDGFDADLAAAMDDALEAPGAGATSDAADTIDRGDNLDVLRQSVSDVLPSADTPVTFNYDEPPPPPRVSPAPTPEEKNPPDTEIIEP